MDRRYRTRREVDRDFIALHNAIKKRDRWETGLVTGAFLLAALAVAIFG